MRLREDTCYTRLGGPRLWATLGSPARRPLTLAPVPRGKRAWLRLVARVYRVRYARVASVM
jgi:hypothetical protein